MAGTVKPARLSFGDTIAVVAPSGTPSPRSLNLGLSRFRQLGLNAYIHPQCFNKRGYLAGDDKIRAEALMDVFSDKRFKAVLCARGGFGCQRLLKHLDIDIIKKRPKIFVGYSDITILLQAFNIDGFVTFHGPMPAIDLKRRNYQYSLRNFLQVTTETEAIGKLRNPPRLGPFRKLRPGKAAGVLTGGNLSLLDKLVGTPYMPSFKGKIVFLEDVDEDPYRLDGYLSHLFYATDISEASGFILGQLVNCRITKRASPSLTLAQVLDDYFGLLKVPVLGNVACGHGKEILTMPLGVKTKIDADNGSIEIMESAVR